MKYLFTLLFLIPFTVSAQFSKGTVAIGGNVSYTSILQDSDISAMPSAKYLTINPSVGVFVTPSFLLGAFVQIYSTKLPTINPYTKSVRGRKSCFQHLRHLRKKIFSAF